MTTYIGLRKELPHGAKIPQGWQMAWYEPRRRIGVYYLVPLHRIMHALRKIVYRLRLALYAPSIECAQVFEMQRLHREGQQLADEYARGYLVGWRECFDTCKQAIEEELSNFDDVWSVGGLLAPASTRRHEN
jgi:hypothetical protein